MSRARLVALPGLLGLALALASPLAATPAYASGLSITIDAPGTAETISGSSTFTVRGRVTPDFLAEVHEVSLRVLSGGSVVATGSGTTAEFSFPVTLPANGLYTLKLDARGRGLVNLVEVTGDADRDFSVAVPPASPTNVSATLLDDRRVKVAWTGVSYLDVRGYGIYRKTGTGGFQLVGGAYPDDPTFLDAPPPGALQYRVVSLRNGAVPSGDANQWLVSAPSVPASVNVPVPPTTPVPPGETSTTTLAPTQPGGTGFDLGDAFSATPATIPPPQITPTPPLPDAGFSPTLPFTEATEAGKVGGRSPGRPATPSASGDLTVGDSAGSSTNRRALLVPVAAGSVLCVAALHLRWLNRRLDAFPTGGGEGGLGGDLEHADFEPEVPEAPEVDRLPVGAGR